LQCGRESGFVNSDFYMFLALITGIIIGFSVAAPVGPIALLIMRRSLNEGRLAGFVSGLGAATADLICGLAAALGLSAITTLINSHRTLLQLAGGIFMVWLGVHAFRARDPATAAARPLHERNLGLAYVFTFLLTMANPLTLLGMVGVVAAAGVGGPAYSHSDTVVLGGGIFLGSAAWWLLLSNLAGWLGRKLGVHVLHVINMTAGALIVGFGAWQLGSLLLHLLRS
jgi:threonine/homoserine/homoserine lactone efflux protein